MSKFLGGVLQGNETVFLTQDEINNPYADIRTMLEDKKRKEAQMKKTLFNTITASPEVLAEKLVYWTLIEYDGKIHTHWMSTITGEVIYDSESEAIAATVARLKEVCNETRSN